MFNIADARRKLGRAYPARTKARIRPAA